MSTAFQKGGEKMMSIKRWWENLRAWEKRKYQGLLFLLIGTGVLLFLDQVVMNARAKVTWVTIAFVISSTVIVLTYEYINSGIRD